MGMLYNQRIPEINLSLTMKEEKTEKGPANSKRKHLKVETKSRLQPSINSIKISFFSNVNGINLLRYF